MIGFIVGPCSHVTSSLSTTSAGHQGIADSGEQSMWQVYLFVVYFKTFQKLRRLCSVEWWIEKELEGSCRGLILRYYPNIHLEGLRKTTKYLYQGSLSPGQDLNLGPPEYTVGVLTTEPWHSVVWWIMCVCVCVCIYSVNIAYVFSEVET
jgi:hypothetical protein